MLVGVDTGEYDCEQSLLELEELAKTAGAQVQAQFSQKRERPDSATCIGKGRLEELKAFCEANETDVVIFDLELSPSQQRNIEEATDVRVIDRTTLILDIFALRARSGEGKLQVELAQLQYSLPRLGGKGTQLSRLGGGIGTRGPGETKLESDRRHIRRRISALEQELEQLEKRRDLARARRAKEGVETVAIVGYTNAGKSTLMNQLTQAGVLVEDKLFATLDPTARALTLPDGRKVMLIDTVGFIRRLPHKLVEAFQSTLEEAASASVILNVCDASSPDSAEHIEVTNALLEELGCAGIPVISVLNKCDLAQGLFDLPAMPNSVMISALHNRGLEQLLEKISLALPQTRRRVKLLLPYSEGALAAELREDGTVFAEEFTENGILLDVVVHLHRMYQVERYLAEE